MASKQWAVERILTCRAPDSRQSTRLRAAVGLLDSLEFKVKWEGSTQSTWIPAENFEGGESSRMLRAFLKERFASDNDDTDADSEDEFEAPLQAEPSPPVRAAASARPVAAAAAAAAASASNVPAVAASLAARPKRKRVAAREESAELQENDDDHMPLSNLIPATTDAQTVAPAAAAASAATRTRGKRDTGSGRDTPAAQPTVSQNSIFLNHIVAAAALSSKRSKPTGT